MYSKASSAANRPSRRITSTLPLSLKPRAPLTALPVLTPGPGCKALRALHMGVHANQGIPQPQVMTQAAGLDGSWAGGVLHQISLPSILRAAERC